MAESRLASLAKASARIKAAATLEQAAEIAAEEARAIVGAHQAAIHLAPGGRPELAIHRVSLSDKYAAWRGRQGHKGIETIAYMLNGECAVYYGNDLEKRVLVRQGEQCFVATHRVTRAGSRVPGSWCTHQAAIRPELFCFRGSTQDLQRGIREE